MDIFIIEIIDADSVHQKLLLEFKKKNITDAKKLNEHCLSYLMVDRILREFYKIENREVIFNNGKPHLKSGLKHFSISHSGDFIALAFSDCNCGIDIEKSIPRDFKKIAERLKLNCQNLDEFYREWTLFEAKYKLGESIQAKNAYKLGQYTVTAVSANPKEDFEIYIQSGQYIPPSVTQ